MPETTSNVKRITLTSKKNWWMGEFEHSVVIGRRTDRRW